MRGITLPSSPPTVVADKVSESNYWHLPISSDAMSTTTSYDLLLPHRQCRHLPPPPSDDNQDDDDDYDDENEDNKDEDDSDEDNEDEDGSGDDNDFEDGLHDYNLDGNC